MNDMGPEAKSLFEAARKAEGLAGRERARIKHAVLLQAATLGVASTVAGGAVAMSMAAKVTLVTLTAAVLGGGSVSVWAWKKHKESTQAPRAVSTQPRVGMVSARSAVVREMPAPEPPAPVPAPAEVQRRAAKPAVVNPRPVPAAPMPAPAPIEIQDRVPEPALINPRPTAAAHVPTLVELPLGASARTESWRRPASLSPVTEIAPAVAPAPGPVPESLDSELNLLRQAQEDLRLGLPARALRRLAGFDRRFPKARLDQERQAIEAIANCQVHAGPAARARAQRFLQNAPLSPLAARVGSACLQDDESRSLNETSARREP